MNSSDEVLAMAKAASDVVRKQRHFLSAASQAARALQQQRNGGDFSTEHDGKSFSTSTMYGVDTLAALTAPETLQLLPQYMKLTSEDIRLVKARNELTVAEDRPRFVHFWSKHIAQFVEDDTQTSYVCPSNLSGYDRKELHRLAQLYNLGHHSEGSGMDRHLVLKKDMLFYRISAPLPSMQSIDEMASTDPSIASARDRRGGDIAGVVRTPVFIPKPELSSTKHLSDKNDEARGNDTLSRFAQFKATADPNAYAVHDPKHREPFPASITEPPEHGRELDNPLKDNVLRNKLMGDEWVHVLSKARDMPSATLRTDSSLETADSPPEKMKTAQKRRFEPFSSPNHSNDPKESSTLPKMGTLSFTDTAPNAITAVEEGIGRKRRKPST